MNEKWLYGYKSREYVKQGRAVANTMSDSAFAAFEEIQQLTRHYNQEVPVANGSISLIIVPVMRKALRYFLNPLPRALKRKMLAVWAWLLKDRRIRYNR